MTRAIAVLKIGGGAPAVVVTGAVGTEVETGTVLIRAYNLLVQRGDFGLYLVSGTNAELTALDASPNCAGGVAITWPAVNVAMPAGIRTRVNAWLTARGLQAIPAGWTWLQLLRWLDDRFDANGYGLMDG